MTLAELTSSLQLTSYYLTSNTITTKYELEAGGRFGVVSKRRIQITEERHTNYSYLVCFDIKISHYGQLSPPTQGKN